MIHIEATLEDLHIEAAYIPDHNEYVVTLYDNITHDSKTLKTTPEILHAIFTVALHQDGKPTGVTEYYDIMNPFIKAIPIHLRPVP